MQRLRTENKLLAQRIQVLEAESSELANKLIQGQVGRAEEVETTFTLKRELAAVRQHYLETMKQLENVTQQYQNLLLVLDETVSSRYILFALFIYLHGLDLSVEQYALCGFV